VPICPCVGQGRKEMHTLPVTKANSVWGRNLKGEQIEFKAVMVLPEITRNYGK